MSIFYGYEKEGDNIKKELPIKGGTMEGDIDMNYWALKNIAAPVDDFDAISKKVLEKVFLNNYLSKRDFNIVFDLNVTKAYDAGDIDFNGTRIKSIRSSQSVLVQNTRSSQPEIGNSASGRYISSVRGDGMKCAMHYYVPIIQYINVHYFFVAVKLARVQSIEWDMLMSDTDDKGLLLHYLAYKGGNDTGVSFGGAYRRVVRTSDIPTGENLFTKHIVSVHWRMGRVYCRLNGTVLAGTYEADVGKNGGTYGTIFANWRAGYNGYRRHSNVQFYGMRIVDGYMTEPEIDTMCNEMKVEYNIT